MGRDGPFVGEEVDVEKVTTDPEVVEDARVEERAAKSTAVGSGLKKTRLRQEQTLWYINRCLTTLTFFSE